VQHRHLLDSFSKLWELLPYVVRILVRRVQSGWKDVIGIIHVKHDRGADLVQVADALRLASGGFRLRENWKEQASQDRNDRDDDQKFNQGEGSEHGTMTHALVHDMPEMTD
jgi:hypothetical protein